MFKICTELECFYFLCPPSLRMAPCTCVYPIICPPARCI